MAVHRRGYRQYDGAYTPERWRFWILSRYAFRRVFQSRLLAVFYALCFVPTLVSVAAVYLSHNIDLLASVFPMADLPEGFELITVNATFFLGLMSFQASLSVLLSVLVGPGLISPDLTNNGLPLFLSRPFSRAEYVLGKFSVLFVLLSLVTTAPMLLIYILKAMLADFGWLRGNLHLAVAIAAGGTVWVTLISLVSMASSAWLRWRPAAAAMIFALFFFPAGFGQAANEIMRTSWGSLLNGIVVIGTAWNSLFFMGDAAGYAEAARNLNPGGRFTEPVPAWSAWLVIAALCIACLLLLHQKIRAHEVVR